ncbi:MAG: ABC transporter permease subunit [Actinomycetota bacterium]
MSRALIYLVLSLPTVGAFAMFSLGIVVMYRASRVLNLAHGAMAMVPVYVCDTLARSGAPLYVWLPIGILCGATLGVIVQRVFVHTLRRQSVTAQTVGTIAAFGLLVALVERFWGTTPRQTPHVFPPGTVGVGSFGHLSYGEIGLFATAFVAAGALLLLFNFTHAGRAMQATADNPRGAALVGIDPDRSTMLAWAIGGALAALAGILLAATSPPDPVHLAESVLPAFVATLIGGLESISGALVGAAVVGVVLGMVPAVAPIPGLGGFAKQLGAPEVVVAIVAFVVMMLRGKKLSLAQAEPALAQKFNARHQSGRLPMPKRTRTIAGIVLAALLIAWPFAHAPFSLLSNAGQAGVLVMIATSLVMLTGWVGQISLAQATFVGFGAFFTALLLNHAGIDFPWSLPISALASAAVAATLGVVALRVRGLYLAVATLIFGWMSSEYLFRTTWFAGGQGGAVIQSKPIGRGGSFPYFDFTNAKPFYFLALSGAAIVIWSLSNMRDSKTGRAFFAVRGSEVAAASLGINVTRTKLAAFSISGAIAGAAGCLIAVGAGAVSLDQFALSVSLFYLSVSVVGGLQSLGGAIAAALIFQGLEEVFTVFSLNGWIDIVSAVLLSVVLLVYPGGMGALFNRLRSLLLRPEKPRVFENAPHIEEDEIVELPASTPLEANGITVRFGGLTAVEGVSLTVGPGQIVGLIGPNGAGKTTLFNAVSGLNEPTEGSVRIFGSDVSKTSVHERAALGVGRTFQLIQLFQGLTVFDNLLVATHLSNKTGVFSHVLATRPALNAERACIERVWRIVDLLGLHDVAGLYVSELSFGTLRMIELARSLVSGAKLIMLDEPASGLDNKETEKLADLLRMIRSKLGVSILLIEHDVRLVTSVSDYTYVIESGKPLAQGTPSEISRNEAVIGAYLGSTDGQASEVAVAPEGERRYVHR